MERSEGECEEHSHTDLDQMYSKYQQKVNNANNNDNNNNFNGSKLRLRAGQSCGTRKSP